MLVLTPACQGLNPQSPLPASYFYSFCDAGDAMQSFVNTKVYPPQKILYLKQNNNYKLKENRLYVVTDKGVISVNREKITKTNSKIDNPRAQYGRAHL